MEIYFWRGKYLFFEDLIYRPLWSVNCIASFLEVNSRDSNIVFDQVAPDKKEGFPKVRLNTEQKCILNNLFMPEIEESIKLFGSHAYKWKEKYIK